MTATKEDDTKEAAPRITQPHLAKQDASTVDATKLTALTPEVVRSSGGLRSSSLA
jgi:hypothetical protein